MQEETPVMGFFIPSLDKRSPLPGSVLETADHPRGQGQCRQQGCIITAHLAQWPVHYRQRNENWRCKECLQQQMQKDAGKTQDLELG